MIASLLLSRRAVLRLFGIGGITGLVGMRCKPKRAETTYGDGRYGYGNYGLTPRT